MDEHPNNPLHGVTLEKMLNQLVEQYGWENMAKSVNIRCFHNDPSIKSSLKFLRKTPWARQKVEALYLSMLKYKKQQLPKSNTASNGGGLDSPTTLF